MLCLLPTRNGRWIGALVLVSAWCLAGGRPATASSSADAQQPSAPRPNVVLVLTDDQDLLLGSLDTMPQTRALIGERGATFTRYFVPLSLCCPSRATILTGRFAHNHKVYTNNRNAGGFDKFLDLGHENETIAVAMQRAGYRTALYGKYLNGYPKPGDRTHVPPGWDEFASPAAGAPYEGFHYWLNENGHLVEYRGHQDGSYLTDVLSAKAVAFIRGAARDRRPFFLYLATYAPHQPAGFAPRHAALFPDLRAPRTPAFDEPDVSDKPRAIRDLPRLGGDDLAAIDELYRNRIRSLQAVDEMVAALVRALGETGTLDDTYVLFTSDNGFHMGQHRMKAGKYTPYEEDVLVPLLVRGPGIAAGRTIAELAESVDLVPTIAALAGAVMPVAPDGRSLLPLLRRGSGEPPPAWRSVALLEQFDFDVEPEERADVLEPPDPQEAGRKKVVYPSHLALRMADWKYVERGSGERELYDLRHDPDELENLGARLDPATQQRLTGLLRALGRCAGETCLALDAQAPPAITLAPPGAAAPVTRAPGVQDGAARRRFDVHMLPHVNAALNALSAIFLACGWWLIRHRRIAAHRACMLAAFASSVLFFVCYAIYHAEVGSVRFPGTGGVRTFYLTLLATHTALAAAVPVLAVWTLARALRRNFPRHRALARWTAPIWLYVSVTGIVVYAMLYQMRW